MSSSKQGGEAESSKPVNKGKAPQHSSFAGGSAGKQGGKAKPLKAPKVEKKEYSEEDKAFLAKKKEEEKALKDLKTKAGQKGAFGGSGLKKSGKK